MLTWRPSLATAEEQAACQLALATKQQTHTAKLLLGRRGLLQRASLPLLVDVGLQDAPVLGHFCGVVLAGLARGLRGAAVAAPPQGVRGQHSSPSSGAARASAARAGAWELLGALRAVT